MLVYSANTSTYNPSIDIRGAALSLRYEARSFGSSQSEQQATLTWDFPSRPRASGHSASERNRARLGRGSTKGPVVLNIHGLL
ncbi:hypothetical protein VZT92_005686 [Zoarces viviparus]|uniref:Uncharacterized protein n=1 Tax=Zoarces viviparus TaxID=48416 RepID=A0AAW1FTX4_ZOAVI